MKSQESTLSRSSEVQERIESIRDSKDESSVKKEEAQLLRMDIQLENASLNTMLLDTLEVNPVLEASQLKDLAEQSKKIVHPQATENLIKYMVEVKHKVQKNYKMFENIYKSKEKGDEAIVTALVGDPSLSITEDKYKVNADYPLAIVIELDEELFDRIDSGKNLGGFYQKRQVFNILFNEDIPNTKITFPMIAVRGIGNSHILSHEKRHAEDRVLASSLVWEKGKHRTVWGPEDHTRLSRNIRILKEEDISDVEELETFEECITNALGLAKHEILAAMDSEKADIIEHMKSLKRQGDVYDFFDDYLGKSNSALKNLLWDRYTTRLSEQTQTAVDLFTYYKADKRFEKRKQIFPSVLSQMPIGAWETQLRHKESKAQGNTEFDFSHELHMLKSLDERFNEIRRSIQPLDSAIPADEEDLKLYSSLTDLRRDYDQYITENSDKQLISYFRQIGSRLDEISEKRANTHIYQTREELDRYNRTYDEAQKRGTPIYFTRNVSTEDENIRLTADNMDMEMWDELRNSPVSMHKTIIQTYRTKINQLLRKP